ncbi:hypothetical protein [Chryseobacterium paridis]|uniref:YD repeat-containing protein n=1 Tax=Chryseobacterium paridis TaxID=2800328 RepID=A0ABS1FWP6_9FLAO|nr:hypothetical protein [Chryseobacterium paridis]MBK1896673.1 hypothetical protein [Chryseobacterium paridis]
MKLLIKTTIILLFIKSFAFAQNVDELIKKDFIETEDLEKNISNKIFSENILQASPVEKRDIFNFNTVNATEVDGFNGKANITIPIYEIKQDGLVIPIQLLYNTGGVKVDQFATEVGLGWSLDAGPVINKEIVGMPDYRSVWGYTQTYGLKEYLHGYLAAEGPSWGIDSPDLYNINIKGGTASFYIDKSFNPILISPYNGINISLTQGRFDEQFVKKYGYYRNFTGVSGVCSSRPNTPTYLLGYYSDYKCENIFKTYKETKSIDIIFNRYTYSFRDADYSIPVSLMTLPDTCPLDGTPCWGNTSSNIERLIPKYNITSINDNLTQKKVIFLYEELAGSNSYIRHSQTFNMILPGISGDYPIPSKIVDGYSRDYDIYMKKLISKIVTDKEQIEFIYLKTREDSKSLDILINSPTNFSTYYPDPLLSEIYIKDKNNRVINMYSFNYEYFNSQCTNPNLQRNMEQCKRLKLVSMVKSPSTKPNEKEEYKFEYYEDSFLPQIGSYRQDPFGYKSSLSDSQTSESTNYGVILPKKPKMFTYTDDIANSSDKLTYVSTIKIPSLNPISDIGYEQTLSNLQNSRAWSLKAIEYPTKAKQYFNYELNSFSWKGNNIQGGGIRISKIDVTDGYSNYSIKYVYENGRVISLPTYNGHQQFSFASNNMVEARPQNFYSKLYYIKGSVVTYDKVSKLIDNKGKTINEYTSINEFPMKLEGKHNPTNTLINLYPYYYGIGNLKFNYLLKKDHIGNLKNEFIYDKNNVLLKETNITYSNQETSFPNNYPIIKNLSSYPTYDRDTEFSYYPIGYPGGYSTSPKFSYLPENYRKLRNNIKSKKITDYFNEGSIITTENYNYLDSHNSIKSITKVLPTEIISEEYLYPFESGLQYNTIMANDERYKFIKTGNIINKNSNFITGDLKFYKNFNGNQLLLSEYKRILQDNSLFTEKTIDQYDSKGNTQQYTTKDGISTTIIWGYNQTQPIAKIEGAKLSDIPQSQITAIVNASNEDASDPTKENLLITALDNFRKNTSLSSYQISTYTYDPLIGVTSVTPPSGIREVYIYDTANRLKEIRQDSKTGNIVKEFKYNYKN